MPGGWIALATGESDVMIDGKVEASVVPLALFRYKATLDKVSSSFRLQLFEGKDLGPLAKTIEILPSRHWIGQRTAVLVVPWEFTVGLVQRHLPVLFHANEAMGVDVYSGGQRWMLRQFKLGSVGFRR
jgi:hypothetical protein